MALIGTIREIVRSEAKPDDLKFHIEPMVRYAVLLAEKCNADKDVVEPAAWLHDIGRIRYGDTDHEKTGARDAEQILIANKCPEYLVPRITHCILAHRSDGAAKPQTLEAQIIANADAMAHFDSLPIFFYYRAKHGTFEEAFRWVEEKITRDWERKLTLPEAREMVEEKYRTISALLQYTKTLM